VKKIKTISHPEGEKGGAGWLTTFNDLVTLLMVFFVLVFSTSSIPDTKKLKDFKVSLQSGLGVLLEGKRVEVGIVESKRINKVEYLMSSGDTSSNEAEEKTPGEQAAKMSTLESLEISIQALDSESGIRAKFTRKHVRITLEDNLLFPFGNADIHPQAIQILDKIIGVIRKVAYPVSVEGHTDNVPIHTAKFPSNWELSIARAVNVVKYFITVGNIDPQRLSAVGYGESKPLFSNTTPENRAMNRRVEIRLMIGGQN
jgi:chemotaxis protein MotB